VANQALTKKSKGRINVSFREKFHTREVLHWQYEVRGLAATTKDRGAECTERLAHALDKGDVQSRWANIRYSAAHAYITKG
jgi:hypothetical protein